MYQYVQKNSGYDSDAVASQLLFPQSGFVNSNPVNKIISTVFFFFDRSSLFWKLITWCLGMYDSDLQIESYLHSNERCIWVVMPETSKQMRELREQNVI